MSEITGTNHPIQVFLNTKQFLQVKKPQGGGGNKDFFGNDNLGFERHKKRLQQDILDVASEMDFRSEPANFLIVQMREEALAKSHRPLKALFTPSHHFALVGGGKLGELFIQCTPESLVRLEHIIEEKAEIVPRQKFNEEKQKLEDRVSSYRSEVGAIETIRRPQPSDRIGFSAEEGVAWLQDPNVIGGYIVEFFKPEHRIQGHAINQLIEKFQARISRLPGGIAAFPISFDGRRDSIAGSIAISVYPLKDENEKRVILPLHEQYADRDSDETDKDASRKEMSEVIGFVSKSRDALDFSIDKHQNLLEMLSSEPLVQSIGLPPAITTADSGETASSTKATIPQPDPSLTYPIVGVIDGGIAKLPTLEAWRAGEGAVIDADDRDEYHGTFIAGLLAGGRALNPHIDQDLETLGCKFFDLDVIPRRGLQNAYYQTLPEFFDQLETLIEKASREAGVRVFNLSLGSPNTRGRTDYSQMAAILDDIALRYDVLFVVSAGNLRGPISRPIWPPDGDAAVAMLATSRVGDDQITAPAEHLLGLTVGALNPPGLTGHEPQAPTTYTCRGPGAGAARKPELSHYGGARPSSSNRTGLNSLSNLGNLVDDRGTSFASPLVSSTVASIDHALQGNVPRETLLALPIHRAVRADVMKSKALTHVSREFVGFGMAPPSKACLTDDPYSVTLVFSEKLRARQELDFHFNWPRSLVTADGKCKGHVDLTLAYTPPIDAQFHAECLRVQLEARLYQTRIDKKTGDEKPESKLKLYDSGLAQNMDYTERYLIESGLKWTPIKRYYLTMKEGHGPTSQWRVSLQSQVRAGASFPDQGVPFSMIMTISDLANKDAIYNEVRSDIIRQGIQLEDITVAHRVKVR